MNKKLTGDEIEILCNIKENSGYERGPYPIVVLDLVLEDDEVGSMRAVRTLVYVGYVRYATCPHTGRDAVMLTDEGFDAYEALGASGLDERVNQY
jgi:hypothetical protein